MSLFTIKSIYKMLVSTLKLKKKIITQSECILIFNFCNGSKQKIARLKINFSLLKTAKCIVATMKKVNFVIGRRWRSLEKSHE